jgi:UDP-N-acetylglucosamine--N-acetylmuramyl-(pentapeptide) pyrophosphoryl-undecaprenol N-acetylglucosamine transferase
MSANAPVLIMAGGTGGHIFPGIAVADELRSRGIPVAWLGARGRLEEQLVPKANIPLHTIAIGAVRGKGFLKLLRAPFDVLSAVLAARRVLRAVQPRSVLSMGGFAAGPGGLAAWLTRVPLVVHEQNRVPGVTNKVLAKFARRVLAGFADAFGANRAEWVGNPVRSSIAQIADPARRFGQRADLAQVLVLGGSQGAAVLNRTVPQALALLRAENRPSPQVRHQCGAAHADAARNAYVQAGVAARVETFIDDMAAAYVDADLVIARAGALTVAELAASGLGAVLVPFAAAVDDHQTKNAQALVAAGAAVLVPERDATPMRLAAVLDELLSDRARLTRMAQAARTLAKPDATARIADVCLEVAA